MTPSNVSNCPRCGRLAVLGHRCPQPLATVHPIRRDIAPAQPKPQGFAALPKPLVRLIAALGGVAAARSHVACIDSNTAKERGRKGGLASAARRRQLQAVRGR